MATPQTLPQVDQSHKTVLEPIATPSRLLFGPGPSNADPKVLQALARSPIGHLDPLYLKLMGEVLELLRYTWQTDNRFTLPMSGTGSAAMEATLANTVESGDTVLVAVNGDFGNRLADMAARYRANVQLIETLGRSLFPCRARSSVERASPSNSGSSACRNIHWRLSANGWCRRSLP